MCVYVYTSNIDAQKQNISHEIQCVDCFSKKKQNREYRQRKLFELNVFMYVCVCVRLERGVAYSNTMFPPMFFEEKKNNKYIYTI